MWAVLAALAAVLPPSIAIYYKLKSINDQLITLAKDIKIIKESSIKIINEIIIIDDRLTTLTRVG